MDKDRIFIKQITSICIFFLCAGFTFVALYFLYLHLHSVSIVMNLITVVGIVTGAIIAKLAIKSINPVKGYINQDNTETYIERKFISKAKIFLFYFKEIFKGQK